MPIVPPKFWGLPTSCLGYLLEPISWVYRGGAAAHKLISRPYRAPVPVISIGNFVLGGAGKTPVTIAVAKTLQAMGHQPHIISRGYGGSLKGPLQVDLLQHQSLQVGDEPLLLAQHAPTWVSKNRKAAVNLAINSGADILLLDDGHQNYTLEKDFSIVVVNEAQGFGNERVFPAGPLRQSIKSGLKTTSALIFLSQKTESLPVSLRSIQCPLIRGKIIPIAPKPCAVMAFTGIGHPGKFRQTLEEAGYEIKSFVPFPDHYPYKEEDLRKLRMRARVERASLITTEKDALRIPPTIRKDILVLPIELAFEPMTALESLLKEFLGDGLLIQSSDQ
jgi:tetraacyldisaccharide 4'-kinase